MELSKRGLHNTKLYHKFLKGADNINTWEYIFFDKNNYTLYHQTSIKSKMKLRSHRLKRVFKGKGYVKSGNLINDPMDFRYKNRISIRDLQGILKRIIFPEIFQGFNKFTLSDSDYDFLRHWMSRTSLESKIPAYNNNEYWDSFNKFLIYGDKRGIITNDIRIYNKVGYAYGTLTDVAYIKDKNSGIEFFLTATILVNKNKIFNDDIYEFEEAGIPFLGALGRGVLKELIKIN